MDNIWIEGLKNKYRFGDGNLIAIEELFDLHKEFLREIYKSLKKDLRELKEDSSIDNNDDSNIHELEVKIEIVKAVLDMKKDEKLTVDEEYNWRLRKYPDGKDMYIPLE